MPLGIASLNECPPVQNVLSLYYSWFFLHERCSFFDIIGFLYETMSCNQRAEMTSEEVLRF